MEVSFEKDSSQKTQVHSGKKVLELPQTTLDYFDGDELRARVFYEKYALKDVSSRIVEKTPEEMFRRVSREIASVEKDPAKCKEWEEKFYWLLSDFRFVPGGRILFGAGQSRRSTLLNCYYLPVKEDSLEAIFDFCKEAGRTYSFGGGVGTDISILRPRGAPVNNAAVHSSGSVSFMELMSVTTGTIGQSGRRGALIITLRVDHPDIIDFVEIKRDLRRVNYANISVLITDSFMEAVEKDTDFELYFKNNKVEVRKRVGAQELWNRLVTSARLSAEPGMIFWDTVKRESPTEYNGMEVHGFNPCSEQCLEDYGCCCLGNINLAAFVLDEFTDKARIDWENLEKASRYTVRFLDNVLDYNADRHPLPEEKRASLWSRRIGVGFTGFGDMLIKLRVKYDEPKTIEFVDKTLETIKNIVYDESSDISLEKGSFPAYEAEKHLTRPFVTRLDRAVLEKMKSQGLRNACLLTVPPVGSGSIIAGTTSGVEPIFALSYLRRSKSLTQGEFKVFHPLVKTYMDRFGISREEDIPPFFVTAHQIKPELRVEMQAAIQKHIDSSISSTVNLPSTATDEDVGKIYFLAWRLGCKGITVFREGSREGILATEASTEAKAPKQKSAQYARPTVVKGETIKFKLHEGNLYVTVNRDSDGVKEVFVNLGKSGGDEKAVSEAIGRIISLYLQQGGNIVEVIKTLKGIQGKHVVWHDGEQLLSVPDAVAKALQVASGVKLSGTSEGSKSKCPDCSEESLISENGCYKCTACGYTLCG